MENEETWKKENWNEKKNGYLILFQVVPTMFLKNPCRNEFTVYNGLSGSSRKTVPKLLL